MKKYQGQTLIELVVFIVIIGIILAASSRVFKSVLLYSSRPGRLLTASQLADVRMNIIIQQRQINGFSNINDPCNTGSLNACTTLKNFADVNGYTISSSISAAVNGVQTATVTVGGTGDAVNVMRFVQ